MMLATADKDVFISRCTPDILMLSTW